MIDVDVRYLELPSREAFRPKRVERAGVTFGRVPGPWPELNRFFYTTVGGPYVWHDRLQWTRAQWMDYLGAPGVETWVLAVDGVPAGYVELVPRVAGTVEIALFGLLPPFVGQGLGAHMLTEAVERAFAMGAERVILDTCMFDHPRAFDNYAARGFREYKRGVRREDVPPTPLPAWPGA